MQNLIQRQGLALRVLLRVLKLLDDCLLEVRVVHKVFNQLLVRFILIPDVHHLGALVGLDELVLRLPHLSLDLVEYLALPRLILEFV